MLKLSGADPLCFLSPLCSHKMIGRKGGFMGAQLWSIGEPGFGPIPWLCLRLEDPP